MDLNKINNTIIKAFEDNKEFTKVLQNEDKKREQLGVYENPKIFLETINLLCAKSKRVIFENKFQKSKRYPPKKVGLNNKGLGVLYYSQLNNFGGDRSWNNGEDRDSCIKIITDDKLFNEILKNVNKSKHNDLKAIRKFYKNNLKKKEDNLLMNTESIEIDLGDLEVMSLTFKRDLLYNIKLLNKKNEDIELPFERLDIDYEEEEDFECLKAISQTNISFKEAWGGLKLTDLRLYLILFKYRRQITKILKQKEKDFQKRLNFAKKENDFLKQILNPLKAVENL